eukprot:Blabericola_migrator_1__380@NODE_1095_length_5456_cov_10_727964_g750_i0_p4_GENE_NODE_1095_length_5456_cov_10_727964_g750_i0NODE_1095_length_5456_cov_10_727964_g750_i0_p4_ORF_typecomplete_len103_score8_42_NODE_1095_length_5456_cov_10_727964_g750_i035393847
MTAGFSKAPTSPTMINTKLSVSVAPAVNPNIQDPTAPRFSCKLCEPPLRQKKRERAFRLSGLGSCQSSARFSEGLSDSEIQEVINVYFPEIISADISSATGI